MSTDVSLQTAEIYNGDRKVEIAAYQIRTIRTVHNKCQFKRQNTVLYYSTFPHNARFSRIFITVKNDQKQMTLYDRIPRTKSFVVPGAILLMDTTERKRQIKANVGVALYSFIQSDRACL